MNIISSPRKVYIGAGVLTAMGEAIITIGSRYPIRYAGEQALKDAEVRSRHDRRRRQSGSFVALEDTGRLHSHDVARHDKAPEDVRVLGYQLRPGFMSLIMSAPRIRATTASLGIASFWIGNVRLLILNVPMIGVWVRLLRVPYKYLFPAVPFFIAVGVYSTKNSLFDVGEVSVFGVIGALLLWLDFLISPFALGFVLGPMLKENFRRAMMLSKGDISVFVQRPISAWFIGGCALLILAQIVAYVRRVGVVPPITGNIDLIGARL
jgi:hypothetical protein